VHATTDLPHLLRWRSLRPINVIIIIIIIIPRADANDISVRV